MESISNLIKNLSNKSPTAINSEKPQLKEFTNKDLNEKKDKALDYERTVFNFLLDNKKPLGIDKVYKAENCRADGLIELSNRKQIAIEIKMNMNWNKACVAVTQFRSFLKMVKKKEIMLDWAIVFFDDFSGDWARNTKIRNGKENGWKHWYNPIECLCEIDKIPVYLLRFHEGKLEIE